MPKWLSLGECTLDLLMIQRRPGTPRSTYGAPHSTPLGTPRYRPPRLIARPIAAHSAMVLIARSYDRWI